MKVSVATPLVLVLFLLISRAWTFTPSSAVTVDWRKCVMSTLRDTRLLSSRIYMSNKDNESSRTDENPPIPSKSTRRTGGRVRNKKRPSKDLVEKTSKVPGWLKAIVIPIVALWILSQTIFGVGDSSSPNYYYYQSSVYQSSVYGPEGRVDTAKKQSIRTNIPSLVDGAGQQQSTLPVIRNDNKEGEFLDYQQRVDEEFDRRLDQEIDSMMRMQRNFLNEFW